MISPVKGYKVFNTSDNGKTLMAFGGYKYNMPDYHHTDEEIEICKTGFHFCRQLKDVYNFYPGPINVVVANITASGTVIHDGIKSVTSDIEIHSFLNGTIDGYSFADGKLHCTDGPAEKRANGDKVWWVEGKLHRVDGPAVECASGDKVWWVEGNLHRIDGPAIEWANGDKVWWVEDKRHRIDGPAVECASGNKEWWVEGKLHRIDGPAIEWASGNKEWWVEGEQCTDPGY